MKIDRLPQEFIELYDLTSKVKYDSRGNGYVYMEIHRGMHGLPQSGILSNKLLKERLHTYGYQELPHTPGLFNHDTRPVWFSLVVDDFGIKYIGKQNALHLINALESKSIGKVPYTAKLPWTGIITTDMSTFPCQIMFTNSYSATTNKNHRDNPKTAHTNRIQSNMEKTLTH